MYCRRHLVKVARAYNQFLDRSTEIIAVSPDSREETEAFFTRARIPFPSIVDPEHHIAETYAQPVVWWKFGRMPAQFIIERGRGVIRLAEYGRSMRDITQAEELLAFVAALPGERPKTGRP